MVDDERIEFADLCDRLTPAQWDQMSLCSEWRVRDVAGHVIEVATLTGPKVAAMLLRYGFRINTMVTREAIKHGTETAPEDLRAEVRATVGLRRAFPGIKPEGVLTGEMIHQQDVRRAVGMNRTIDPRRVRIALDQAKRTMAGVLFGRRWSADLFLRAVDMDWQAGTPASPEVEGTGEALLMAMAGRATALDDLTGPGLEVIRSRS